MSGRKLLDPTMYKVCRHLRVATPAKREGQIPCSGYVVFESLINVGRICVAREVNCRDCGSENKTTGGRHECLLDHRWQWLSCVSGSQVSLPYFSSSFVNAPICKSKALFYSSPPKKANTSFVISARQTVRMERTWFPLEGFSWNLIVESFLENLSRKLNFN